MRLFNFKTIPQETDEESDKKKAEHVVQEC